MRPHSYVHVLLLPLLAGCAAEPTRTFESGDPVRVGASLEFIARLSDSEIHLGEQTTLTLVLRNRGTDPVTLDFSSGCQLLPYIERVNGERVYPGGEWLCTAALTKLTLEPGDSATREVLIRTGVAQEQRFSNPVLAPGRYVAWGALGNTSDRQGRTASVELTVLE